MISAAQTLSPTSSPISPFSSSMGHGSFRAAAERLARTVREAKTKKFRRVPHGRKYQENKTVAIKLLGSCEVANLRARAACGCMDQFVVEEKEGRGGRVIPVAKT